MEVKIQSKSSQLINVSFKGSEYSLRFNPSMYYNYPLELALHYVSTYNTIPNLTNCKIDIIYTDSNDNDSTKTLEINIPTGAYEISDINNYIVEKIKGVGLEEDVFLLEPNNQTAKSIIKLKAPIYRIEMNDELKSILGFGEEVINKEENISENNVQITKINSINIEVDIIEGSTVNGSKKPIIYSFFPNVGFGYKIINNINNPIYLPVFTNPISNINIRITDQNGNQINNQNELVDLRFHLREA